MQNYGHTLSLGPPSLHELVQEANTCIPLLPISGKYTAQNLTFIPMNANKHIGRGWTQVSQTKSRKPHRTKVSENMREWQCKSVNLMDIAKVTTQKKKGLATEYEMIKNPADEVLAYSVETIDEIDMDEWVDVEEFRVEKKEGPKKMLYSEAASIG